VFIDLIQHAVEPIVSIGYFVYKVSADVALPLDYRFLVKHFDSLVPSVRTGRYVFVQSMEADGVYLLESGRRYVVIAFADKPTDAKRFSVVMATHRSCRIDWRPFNI
jgi:hypothetical protein